MSTNNSPRHRRKRPVDDGFSLIELLIVIVVLGILATVVVFSVRGVTDNGQEAACGEDARILATAVEAYFAQEGGDALPTDGGTDGDRVERYLVNAGFVRHTSEYWDVREDGALMNVTPC